jgi:hypothetical protein
MRRVASSLCLIGASLAVAPAPGCLESYSTCAECLGGGAAGAAGMSGESASGGLSGASGGRSGGGEGGSGGGAGGGSTGGTAAEPCDGGCEEPMPLCDEGRGACVECLVEGDCEFVEGKPGCDVSDGACVECLTNAHCEEGVCDASANKCVECLSNDDCTETSARVCDPETHRCEACLSESDCEEAQNARCDASGAAGTNACVGCTESEQCAGHVGTTVCDASEGECVECTGLEYGACGTSGGGERLVCDSLSRSCSPSETERSSGLCGECISDAECGEGQACVLQRYEETDVGYFCFWQKGGSGGAPTSCLSAEARPYVGTQSMAESIDGVVADVCGLALTTCTAMNQFRSPDVACAPLDSTDTPVPDDSLCGEPGLADGYCREADADVYRCTVPCLSSDDCRSPSDCNTEDSSPFCNLNP